MAWKSSFRQNDRKTFLPTFPTSAARISHVVADVEAPGGENWEQLKSGGKQWQATSKNLPRMQRTRAIPVAWLNSGLCPDRPKGWISTTTIIIIMIMINPRSEKEMRLRFSLNSCIAYRPVCAPLDTPFCRIRFLPYNGCNEFISTSETLILITLVRLGQVT